MSRSGSQGPRHTPLRVVLRWAAGKHWHGQPRSDATFWSRGTEPVGESWWGRGRGSWWALAAGWQRLGARAVLAAVLYGLWRWRTGTEWVLGLTGGPVAGLRVWRAVEGIQMWRHRRQLERPMALALAPFLGIPARAVESALVVEPGYDAAAGGQHVAALQLPDHWAGRPEQKETVEEILTGRLGVDLKFAWRLSGYPMVVNALRAPTPPLLVPFASMRAAIEAAPPARVLLGPAADGALRWWDETTEDPHIAVHGGSRRGKTSLLHLIAAQDLRQGAELVVGIDPKRVSLLALAGCGPQVELHNNPRDIEGMWAGIKRFRQLVEDRYDQLEADPTTEFARARLIIDELSMFAAMSAAHWRKIKDKGDPAVPRVWEDVAAAVWMGAQCRAYVVVAGQRLDYQTLGGMLGSFGTRLLAGYAPQDYARLVGVPPFQRSQKPRGRFLLYAGGELDWIQLVFGEPDEWRAWVMSGRESGPDLRRKVAPATADVVIGLAAGAGHLGLKTATFRKRRDRSGGITGEFRVGNQPAWQLADLDHWAEPITERTP
jgi:hypothetical protein